MPAFRSKVTTDARPRRVTTWQGNHKTARNETAPAPGRVRLGGAVRTTPRHLLTIFQEGFPCCLAFSFKNALRTVRRGFSGVILGISVGVAGADGAGL